MANSTTKRGHRRMDFDGLVTVRRCKGKAYFVWIFDLTENHRIF